MLADEALLHLEPRDGGLYCDGTVGGGGHAERILATCPRARLLAFDRDPDALAAAGARLAPFADRLTLVHGAFADITEHLAARGIDRVDGILLDLGVSSPQLDRPERGFSFSQAGPLDMRMDPTRGETALELMRRVEPGELADLLFELGDERYSRRIAARIKEALRADALATTAELAALVTAAIPAPAQRKMKIHPATRTFQALRIAVNGELEQLQRFLDVFPAHLAPGGRCVIISFHSLEDRLVKHRFRDLAWTSSLPPALAVAAGEPVEPTCRVITRKAIFASDAEIARNPRARSARLRACEKVAS